MKAHGHQKRASGDPYFSHPLEVAAILTELRLDDATIATALLHDVIEDTDATRSEIDHLFGPEIGALVDGLTKIKRLDLVSKKAEQAENFRKLLVAISSDIRVLLVKLADRLHNMRTLEHMKPESRKRIFRGDARHLRAARRPHGHAGMRDELEDHAFRWLHPEAYKTVTGKLAELRHKNRGLVEDSRKALAEKLAEVGIKAEVFGREKKPYAIWRKMANKQISLEQLSDIYAFRVIVDTIDDCYRVLGVAHTTWRTVPGRFKDYISTPKQNNYQSIHTTVVGPRHQRIELQIRTRAMHDIAEYGVAAHALYKDRLGGNGQFAAALKSAPMLDKESGPYVWLRRLVETLLEGSNPEEFPRAHQARAVPGPGVLLHAQGPADRAAAWRHPARLRLRGAHRHRQRRGRRLRQRPPRCPSTRAAERRRGGDPDLQGRTRRRRPGRPSPSPARALGDPARGARCRAPPVRGARPPPAWRAFERIATEFADDKLKRALPKLGHKTLEDALAAVGATSSPVNDVVRAIAPDASFGPSGPVHRPRNRWDRRPRPGGLVQPLQGDGPQVPRGGRAGSGPQRGGVPIRGWRPTCPLRSRRAARCRATASSAC